MNERRQGTTPITPAGLAKMVDRLIRNRCLVFRQQGNYKFAAGISLWLSTRLLTLSYIVLIL